MRRRLLIAVLLLLPACGSDEPVAAPPSSPVPVPSSSPSPSASPSASGAGPVVGTPVDPTLAAEEAGLDPAGAVDAVRFTDAAGEHVAVLRRLGTDRDPALRADLVLLAADGPRSLRQVRDGDAACELDEKAEFVDGSLQVLDGDGDGTGEVQFAYRVDCRGDVGASELKLLVLQGADKLILRGFSTNQFEPEQPDPEPEPAPSSWPDGAYERALAAFRDVPPEF